MGRGTEHKIGANRGNAGKGRPKGSLNKATADVKAIAQPYSREAVETLATIMRDGKSERAQVAAAQAILDRAWGRPPQALTGEGGGPVQHEVIRKIIDTRAGK